jgi:glycosyltransferase involved in cell wall biosynthesis
LVDDGSPDNSLEVCKGLIDKAQVPMTLIDLARNYGEHNAVMAGLRHSRGAHVITMDDDLQNPPEEVQCLLGFATAGPMVTSKILPRRRRPVPWRKWVPACAGKDEEGDAR